jgi:hypothetical protein
LRFALSGASVLLASGLWLAWLWILPFGGPPVRSRARIDLAKHLQVYDTTTKILTLAQWLMLWQATDVAGTWLLPRLLACKGAVFGIKKGCSQRGFQAAGVLALAVEAGGLVKATRESYLLKVVRMLSVWSCHLQEALGVTTRGCESKRLMS